MNKYIKNYLDGLMASLDPCPSTKTTYDLKQFKANNILNNARRKAMQRFYSTVPGEIAQQVVVGKHYAEIRLHKSDGGLSPLSEEYEWFIEKHVGIIIEKHVGIIKKYMDDFEASKTKRDEDIKNKDARSFQELDDQ